MLNFQYHGLVPVSQCCYSIHTHLTIHNNLYYMTWQRRAWKKGGSPPTGIGHASHTGIQTDFKSLKKKKRPRCGQRISLSIYDLRQRPVTDIALCELRACAVAAHRCGVIIELPLEVHCPGDTIVRLLHGSTFSTVTQLRAKISEIRVQTLASSPGHSQFEHHIVAKSKHVWSMCVNFNRNPLAHARWGLIKL